MQPLIVARANYLFICWWTVTSIYLSSEQELEKMKEIAKLKQLPPVYTGKWATATKEEVQEELEKGTPYTYRFRVPKEGSLKIVDLIRGEVSVITSFSFLFRSRSISFSYAFNDPILQVYLTYLTVFSFEDKTSI